MIIQTKDIKRSFVMGSSTVDALKGINFGVEKREFIKIIIKNNFTDIRFK